jgi:hypothetical protein
VVNLRDAAAEGSKGLLHPLLKRFHVSNLARQLGTPTTAEWSNVLPAVAVWLSRCHVCLWQVPHHHTHNAWG